MSQELSYRVKLRSAILSWPAAVVAVLAVQVVLSFGLKRVDLLCAYRLIVYFMVLVLATSVACLNAVEKALGQRWFWAFLALGYGLWGLDSWLWVYYRLILHRNVPDTSMADPALFLHVVPFIAALATHPELGQSSPPRHQTTLNFLLVLFFWAFLYAFFVFPYQFLLSDSAVYNLRSNALYFAENVALIAALATLLSRTQPPWRSLYWHLLCATSVYAVASLLANIEIDRGSYYPGKWIDLALFT
jgi:hypothetical protein